MKKTLALLISVLTCISILSISVYAEESKEANLKIRCFVENGSPRIEAVLSTDFDAGAVSGKLVVKDMLPQNSEAENLSYISSRVDSAGDNQYNTDEYPLYENGKGLSFGIFGNVAAGGSKGNWLAAEYSKNATDGKSEFSVDALVVSDAQGNKIPVTADSVEVQLNWIRGDANGDLSINIIDLIRVKKTTAGVSCDVNYEYNSDYDESGTVDSADLAALRKVLLQKQ